MVWNALRAHVTSHRLYVCVCASQDRSPRRNGTETVLVCYDSRAQSNAVRYLELTLRSMLSKDPGAEVMQIEVVDDASTTNDPEPLVRHLGGDRVVFFARTSCL
jgi:hypothetical protein